MHIAIKLLFTVLSGALLSIRMHEWPMQLFYMIVASLVNLRRKQWSLLLSGYIISDMACPASVCLE